MKRVAKTGDDSWEKFKIIGKGQIDDRTFKVHIQTRDGDSLRNTLQRSQRRLSAAGVQGAAAGVGNLHSRGGRPGPGGFQDTYEHIHCCSWQRQKVWQRLGVPSQCR